MKLNQVIAVVSEKKTRAAQCLTDAYHLIQKTGLMDGITRTYQPKDDEGERLPDEAKTAQCSVSSLIKDVCASFSEMVDVVATQDVANCSARANVVLNDTIILTNVPVTHLLFLAKQLTDLATFVSKLPVLDPSDTWEYDSLSDCYKTRPSETVRTKKVPKAFVKYEATKEHPAQVDTFNDDIIIGYWKTTKFSGALPAAEKNAMLSRVRHLHEAVVKAREEANNIDINTVDNGRLICDFVFGSYLE